jgi:hypothetical protein
MCYSGNPLVWASCITFRVVNFTLTLPNLLGGGLEPLVALRRFERLQKYFSMECGRQCLHWARVFPGWPWRFDARPHAVPCGTILWERINNNSPWSSDHSVFLRGFNHEQASIVNSFCRLFVCDWTGVIHKFAPRKSMRVLRVVRALHDTAPTFFRIVSSPQWGIFLGTSCPRVSVTSV